MAFAELRERHPAIGLLEQSLVKGRVGHAYLFTDERLEALETIARTMAKALNCLEPPQRADGRGVEICDRCPSCVSIEAGRHPDVHWVRPEAKSRVITIHQIRALMAEIQLKPHGGLYKVAVIVAADRLNIQAANAFLKTLEEPPERSLLLLLSTSPDRLLETILSRCLRINFSAGGPPVFTEAQQSWIKELSAGAASGRAGVLGRYRLLGILLAHLEETKKVVQEQLGSASLLQRYEEVESSVREKWEIELAAAVEAEYRRRRGELLLAWSGWLRDIWLMTLGLAEDLLLFPEHRADTQSVARRLDPPRAMENLRVAERTQRLLETNVQEGLTLEVGFLQLTL